MTTTRMCSWKYLSYIRRRTQPMQRISEQLVALLGTTLYNHVRACARRASFTYRGCDVGDQDRPDDVIVSPLLCFLMPRILSLSCFPLCLGLFLLSKSGGTTITINRLPDGDEFTSPFGCLNNDQLKCPSSASVTASSKCMCKCPDQNTWMQDMGKCVDASGLLGQPGTDRTGIIGLLF